MYTGIRLLLFICPFVSSFFFLSNFQTLKFFRNCEAYKVETWYTHNNGVMYCVYQNQAAAMYLSLYFFIFLSLQFSSFNNFCHTFLRNCKVYKVETWYTSGQWVDVLCTLEQACCRLFVPSFFFLSKHQKLASANLFQHMSDGYCRVYVNLCSLFFFLLLFIQFSLKIVPLSWTG